MPNPQSPVGNLESAGPSRSRLEAGRGPSGSKPEAGKGRLESKPEILAGLRPGAANVKQSVCPICGEGVAGEEGGPEINAHIDQCLRNRICSINRCSGLLDVRSFSWLVVRSVTVGPSFGLLVCVIISEKGGKIHFNAYWITY